MQCDDLLDEIRREIDAHQASIWKSTDKFKWIRDLNTHTKGSVGEKLIERVYRHSKILPRTSSEHDLIIDGQKFEIKLSCLNESKLLKWGHIKLHYDFDILCLIGVYPNELKVWNVPKSQVAEAAEQKILKPFKLKSIEDRFPNSYLPIDGFDVPSWLAQYEKTHAAIRGMGLSLSSPVLSSALRSSPSH